MKFMKELKNLTRKKTEAASNKATVEGPQRSKTVTIEARIDIGYGNTLYVRGQGHGLNWSQGVPLKCMDSSTWKWTGTTDEQVRFKLLLNDSVWAQGDDLVAAPGQSVEVAPTF